MRAVSAALCLGVLAHACGGVGDDTKPIQALAAPTAAPPPPVVPVAADAATPAADASAKATTGKK